MGTRCLTRILDEEDREIVTIYRQFDGYPSGHGAELKRFCKRMRIVCGIRDREAKNQANGPGCFAAQLVTSLKRRNRVGNIYLYRPGTKDVGEEYIYTIHCPDEGFATIEVEETISE